MPQPLDPTSALASTTDRPAPARPGGAMRRLFGRLRRFWRGLDAFLRDLFDAMGRYPRVPRL